MKKLFALLLAAIMCVSLAACGNDTTSKEENGAVNTTVDTTESTNQDSLGELCVGTWKWDFKASESNDWGVETMELFKGGTGKGTNSMHSEGQYYPLTWEVKDDVLVVSFEADPLSCAFELDGDKLTTTDGKLIYNRQ